MVTDTSLTVGPTVAELARSWSLSLEAANRSPKTLESYLGSLGVCPRNNVLSDMRH